MLPRRALQHVAEQPVHAGAVPPDRVGLVVVERRPKDKGLSLGGHIRQCVMEAENARDVWAEVEALDSRTLALEARTNQLMRAAGLD